MQRFLPLVIVLALLGGGAWLLKVYEIEGLDSVRLRPRGDESSAGESVPVKRSGNTIRIATFNIQSFGPTKRDKPHVLERLAEIVRRFDVVAIQEIRSVHADVMPLFLDVVNAGGRRYDFLLGEPQGRGAYQEQYAFLFDRASVELDRYQSYTVDDPDDLLHRPPLVGWFRVRGPAADEAFTFTLVNIHTDPDTVRDELRVLDDVMRLVRNDGRDEDDVILLGDFNAAPGEWGDLDRIPGIVPALRGEMTNTRRTRSYDNLILQTPATSEFTGRSGVLDFLREYNLSLDEALEVSDHLPVWAEFSIYEGGPMTTARAAPAAGPPATALP